MAKVSGFDGLARTFKEAAKALEGLDEIGSVAFDPEDPGSIEGAIAEMSRLIDEKLQPYGSNALVEQLADSMKETYRKGILEKAAEARLKGDAS